MKKFLTLSAMLTLALLFGVAVASRPDSSSTTFGVSVVPVHTNSPAIPEQTHIAPGIYTAKPYAMIVVVPPSIDEKMIVSINTPESKMPVVTPETRLKKR